MLWFSYWFGIDLYDSGTTVQLLRHWYVDNFVVIIILLDLFKINLRHSEKAFDMVIIIRLRYDINCDGIISPEELASGIRAKQKFNKAKKNKDGNLSREEWIAMYVQSKLTHKRTEP